MAARTGLSVPTEGVLDPFVVSILRSALLDVAEEMKIRVIRSAHGHILSQARDFGCAVMNDRCEIVAESVGLPGFQGCLGLAAEAVVDKFGWDRLRPGDIILHNDPYVGGGNHLNDVVVLAPVFARHQPAGFVAIKAHWMDIGASIPGIGSMVSTDIHEEGVRIYAVRLYSAGELNEDVAGLINSNIRGESGVLHDVDAVLAACKAGVAGFGAVLSKYGLATVQEAAARMHVESEERTRAAIEAIPDGFYRAEGVLDNDGVDPDDPVRIVVEIEIDGSDMRIDLSECSAQRGGPVNCGAASTIANCRLLLKCVTTPDDPSDEGSYRPLTIDLPPGLVLSAREPAPVAKYAQVGMLLVETGLRALADVLPGRIPAGGHGDNMSHPMFGREPETGRLFMMADSHMGGMGALPDRDGESALYILAAASHRCIPIELLEARHPYVNILRFQLRTDSGGPGRHRGGLGIVREWRFDADLKGTFSLERSKCPPWGLDEGHDGRTNHLLLDRPGGGAVEEIRKASALPIVAGSKLTAETGGGGGVGDPFDRPPQAVLEDVLDGMVSVAGARADYGVVLTGDGREIDMAETERMRTAR